MNVYLIRQAASDLFKIGVSKHVPKRLKENQTGNGNQLEVITTVPSEIPYKVEALIHKRWHDKKQIGEWFILTEEDVINFETICREIEVRLKYLEENNTWIQSVKRYY